MSATQADPLRIPITSEYLAGREAFKAGKEYFDAAEGITDFYRRIDAYIGWGDERDGVSVEERAEVEARGETWAA